jgi:hypothetical protein
MVKLKVMTLGDVDKVFLYENDFSWNELYM